MTRNQPENDRMEPGIELAENMRKSRVLKDEENIR